MPKKQHNAAEAFLPLGLPAYYMLLSLSRGERHGYALKREILHRTGGKKNLGSGALYGSINKLLEGGLIEESSERPDPHLDDARRRYYRITPLGLQVVQAEAIRLRELARLAEGLPGLPELAR
jgi:DNA-binding PadR family transcriptional regulator